MGPSELKGVSFAYRLVAFFIDLAVIVAISMVLLVPLHKIAGMRLFAGLVALGVLWAYFACSESSTLQATPGKRLLGLKVVDLSGNRLSLAQATGRHFSRKIAYCACFGLGTLAVLRSARKQALHDWASLSLVVKSDTLK